MCTQYTKGLPLLVPDYRSNHMAHACSGVCPACSGFRTATLGRNACRLSMASISEDARLPESTEAFMEESYVPLLLMRHNRPLRGVMIDRQPWVCAKEFGLLMGHRHPERICRLMDDDQVRTVTFCTRHGDSESVEVLSESGLYRVLCRFSHPENRSLRRWLTHEALPALRDAWEHRTQEPKRTLMAWDRQRISLLEWQGDLWIALRDMPRFAPPPATGERSLRALLNRWWH